MSKLVVTYEFRALYHQDLNAPSPSKKEKERDDILETFTQFTINLLLLEFIKQILATSLKTSAHIREIQEMPTLIRLP